MIAKGTFEVQMTPQPPFDERDGVPLARMTGEKQFSGALVGTGHVEMLTARTGTADSACYVALERVVATLEGKTGSFVFVHRGIHDRGASTLQVTVVPDSGAGGLVGLTGAMTIDRTDGGHAYTFDYALPASG